MKKYEPIEHTADIGLRIYGDDLEELFKNGFYGLLVQVTDEKNDGNNDDSNDTKMIELKAPDNEALLIDFLNEILYLINAEKWMPSKIKMISINDNELKAEFCGDKFESGDIIKTEVKAATYHNIEIKKENNMWVTNVFFDV